MTATHSAPRSTSKHAGFRALGLADLPELFSGKGLYKFREFYETKDAILRYDDRKDYLNYGYFRDGQATANPSAELVRHVATLARIGPADTVVDIGSGLGQPALDVAKEFGAGRVIGLNTCAEQVAYANARARAAGLAKVVEHRAESALEIGRLRSEGVTVVMAVEALAEIADIEAIVRGAFDILPEGGRLCFCDIVASGPAPASGLGRRALEKSLMAVTTAFYGDHWLEIETYDSMLRRAGFDSIEVERIGDRVYGPCYRHARSRIGSLDQRPGTRGLAALFAHVNLRGLERLHAWGSIDYAVFVATK